MAFLAGRRPGSVRRRGTAPGAHDLSPLPPRAMLRGAGDGRTLAAHCRAAARARGSAAVVMAGPMGMVKLFVRSGVSAVGTVYGAYRERMGRLGTGRGHLRDHRPPPTTRSALLKAKQLQREGISVPMPWLSERLRQRQRHPHHDRLPAQAARSSVRAIISCSTASAQARTTMWLPSGSAAPTRGQSFRRNRAPIEKLPASGQPAGVFLPHGHLEPIVSGLRRPPLARPAPVHQRSPLHRALGEALQGTGGHTPWTWRACPG